MYEIQVEKKEVFGIGGYKVPRKYVSNDKVSIPYKQKFQAKPKSAEKQITQKGFYLDEQIKQLGKSPGPQQYTGPKKWILSEREREKLGIPKPNQVLYKQDRQNFLDVIERRQSLSPTPGCGAYKSEKSDFDNKLNKHQKKTLELIHEEQSKKQKPCFIDQFYYEGTVAPGPGQYYPRAEIKKIHVDQRDLVYWKDKHKQPSPLRVPRNPPGVGTYNHHPLAYKTFAKLQEMEDEKQGNKKKNKKSYSPLQKKGEKFVHYGFGVSVREVEPKFSKSKIKLLPRPGPGTYNLIASWGERQSKKNEQQSASPPPRRNNYLQFVTTGVQKSIYYDSSPNLV
ncbi:hypothetical protein ABPG74_005045 [Tetrahymena malaccensis]